jgi:hypothetical protein
MNNWTNGFVLTVVGMGGTLFSLWLITVIVEVLKKLFPYREAEEAKREVV